MKIVPFPQPGDCRTGTGEGYTVSEINAVLGFEPNCEDDPSKVKVSWGFKADGVHCGVWDYKGSYKYKTFSFYGPKEVLEALFPPKV